MQADHWVNTHSRFSDDQLQLKNKPIHPCKCHQMETKGATSQTIYPCVSAEETQSVQDKRNQQINTCMHIYTVHPSPLGSGFDSQSALRCLASLFVSLSPGTGMLKTSWPLQKTLQRISRSKHLDYQLDERNSGQIFHLAKQLVGKDWLNRLCLLKKECGLSCTTQITIDSFWTKRKCTFNVRTESWAWFKWRLHTKPTQRWFTPLWDFLYFLWN